LILLNSISSRFPNGLGNDNGLLGKFMAFHNYRASAGGEMPGFEDRYTYGRNPTNPVIANYRNLHKKDADYLGGYLTFVWSNRSAASAYSMKAGIGSSYKESLTEPGPWVAGMFMQGETIPHESNHVKLSKDLKDPWGIPQLITSIGYDEHADKMVADFRTQSSEMLEKAGCKNIQSHDTKQAPGLDIHEMGGCRMGKNPKDSILNEWNQVHHCKNVFVTDGACMTSTGTQSPSILYMAFAARAANHAAEEMKRGNL
jgi:choline dehydrogenase-like flavoprotein